MTHPVWSAGFRAFFGLAALNAIGSLATWLAFLSGAAIPTQGWPAPSLHAHEMLHGTVVPVVAGFLLTAVPNWTKTVPLAGVPVAGLVGLWLAGRLALALGDVFPPAVVLGIDVAFLPVLAAVVGMPILRARQLRNALIPLILLALAAANAAMHVALARGDALLMRAALASSVHLVVVLILVIAGRILPLFTRNALRRDGIPVEIGGDPRVGGLALGVAAAALALDLARPGSDAGGWVALAAVPLLLLRQLGWRPRLAWGRPMLWVLHAGHAWIAVGFACLAAAALANAMPWTAALHAFTAGGMGCMMLGMMTRVSLGHTGRPIEASRPMVLAFASVLIAAIVRVFGPLAPQHTLVGYQASGLLFSAGYGLFLLELGPVLWRPRADAAPTAP